MPKPTLIALTGPAGCGKDTVRRLLEQIYGYQGIAFADPMRDMLAALLRHIGTSTAWMTDRDLKEKPIPGLAGISYRRMAQTLGTEWAQQCLARDFWVRIAEQRHHQLRQAGAQHIVISDLRFHHEAAWVKNQGGEIWRVVRDAIPVRLHESEMQLHAIAHDRVVLNTSSLPELAEFVHSMFWERQA